MSGVASSRYGVIVADPAWSYHNGGNGAAKNHYPTLTTAEICALEVNGRAVGELAADDCVLLLWATWPLLPDALHVMAAWGFSYKSGFPWVKLAGQPVVSGGELVEGAPAFGTGFWVRGCTEMVLIGVRGKPAFPALPFAGLISRRFPHSRKPDNLHEYAEALEGPWLELFARRPRAGWDVWGNDPALGAAYRAATELETA